MLIINADDWGRSRAETDAALNCFKEGRITSVTAMVFMADSERAAELAKEHKIDVGLHLNLNQRFDGRVPEGIARSQEQIVKFLTLTKYAMFVYHPGLRTAFRNVFKHQWDEVIRLYGKPPSHIDGHQHRHLCANMLVDAVIPPGQRVRRNFSFWPGEKALLNRTYRKLVDRWLRSRYQLTDFFFSLGMALKMGTIHRISDLAARASVELMTHPVHKGEYTWLMGNDFRELIANTQMTSFDQSSTVSNEFLTPAPGGRP